MHGNIVHINWMRVYYSFQVQVVTPQMGHKKPQNGSAEDPITRALVDAKSRITS